MRTTRFTPVAILALIASIGISTSANAGGTYRFTVSCPRSHVALWETGDIDPGREWLRVATGTNNAGCSISDFNAATDSDLPVDKHSHEGAVIEGIPLIGTIACGLFDC